MVSQTRKQKYWLGGKREAAQDRFFLEALDRALWTEGDADDWDTCWYTGMPDKSAFRQLDATRTINHIPGNNGLTIKSNLYRTLAEMHERIAAQEGHDSEAARRLRFFPKVYSMPTEYHALQEAARDNPAAHWILKPKNAARGKGISVLEDVALAPLDNASMVQAYVGNPHTMWGHKYVLRLYAVITSVVPLRVYLYEEGSAKLASAPYDPEHFDNVYAHLTNPDVNATNTESESPVVFRSLASYRQWLRDDGHDDEKLFARLRDMVALTAIGVRERMRNRLAEIDADTSGCYELLGFDCLVDADLNPWILECNLSPSLEVCAAPKDGGDVEEQTKRRLVADLVHLLNLNGTTSDADGIDDPVARLRAVAEGELARAGDYTRVYPNADPAAYLPFFPLPRHADLVLADAVTGTAPRPSVRPHRVQEIIGEGRLGLYGERDGTLYTPNDVAAWIWLQATDGMAADDIADSILEAQRQAGQPADDWTVRQQVWDVLADSAVSGLLLQHAATDATEAADNHQRDNAASGQTDGQPSSFCVIAGERMFRIMLPDEAVAARVAPVFPAASADTPPEETLSVLRSGRGYAVADGAGIQADGLRLAQVAPVLRQLLLARGPARADALTLDGVLVPLGDRDATGRAGTAVLVTSRDPALAGSTATMLAGALASAPCSGGIHLGADRDPARAAGLPLLLQRGLHAAPTTDHGARHIHQTRAGATVDMLAPPRSPEASGYTVTTVLVAGTGASGGAGDSLQPADRLDVLSAMLPVLNRDGGHPPSCSQLDGLSQRLDEWELLTLDVTDAATARQALEGWITADTNAIAESS
ncbi:tubulin--tyrosine ligase family protein [Aquisalimonas sp. 2447]|uniref:tubulin--tyrosine ligase family protein n=1 Tax=Aquisalimonas sp. 2447 TaxID=2740807 RepID=UPI0014327EA3|nr:tubulin--tyrosine ligase family protein [Aquisalimonas sp. 2447]QIT56082.1 tubulin--tyrosine ligase family protein [Aquisalimonas sp. 2447]